MCFWRLQQTTAAMHHAQSPFMRQLQYRQLIPSDLSCSLLDRWQVGAHLGSIHAVADDF